MIEEQKARILKYIGYLILILLVATVSFFVYQSYVLTQDKNNLEKELLSERNSHETTSEFLSEYKNKYEQMKYERDELESDLDGQIAFVEKLIEEVVNMGGTVSVLDKLSKIDPELLQKYSKVFFLNEHYRPKSFAQITQEYIYPDTDLWIQEQVWPHLEGLLQSASSSETDLLVFSAYRSFDTQAKIKSSFTVTYGTGANQFSADQGYSEHQLGTTVDFTTSENGNSFYTFDETATYEWLLDNAHLYGYIISYPEDNGYYRFEPWHWSFVGKDLATRQNEEGSK